MKRSTVLTAVLVALPLFTACRKDSVVTPSPTGQTGPGVFIINEGPFPSAGSVTYYSLETDSVIGEVVPPSAGWITPNDAIVFGRKLYVIVIGNDRVEVLHTDTFEHLKSIPFPARTQPGYFCRIDSTTAFVANYNGTISRLDLQSDTIVGTSAAVVDFPGGIAYLDGMVYVTNLPWPRKPASELVVMNALSFTIVDTITLGHAASQLATNGTSTVFALCEGMPPDSGVLYAINASGRMIIDSIGLGVGPTEMTYRNGLLFVLHPDHIMELTGSPLAIIDSTYIELQGGTKFYAMSLDVAGGNLYVSVIVSSGGSGEVAVFAAKGGFLKTRFPVGIFPGAFAFKE